MNRTTGVRILVAGVTTAVIAAIVAAIVVLGSPAQQRQRRLDERRVRDLSTIVNAIRLYAATHQALPPDLSALNKQPGLPRAPSDPDTGAPYDYSVLNADSYQLCATFAMPTPDNSQPYVATDGWTHDVGQQCFERKQKVGRK